MLWHRQAIFESKEDNLSASAEYRIRTQGLRHETASRLNAHWQTEWAIEDQAKNLNSTARPYVILVQIKMQHISCHGDRAPSQYKDAVLLAQVFP